MCVRALLCAIPALLPACGLGSSIKASSDAAAPDNDDGGMTDAASDAGPAGPAPVLAANVTVDTTAARAVIAPNAFGLHASVYDNSLHDPRVPPLLRQAGVGLLRWPGGGYADNYHWSNHRMTPWFGNSSQGGYLAAGSDFGGFVELLETFDGAAMITVNYGSNLAGTGPGEPNEAAAWVAYANGDPASDVVIGADSTGSDWGTVGTWASLRAANKLATEDGKNMLRIAHPAPLGIRYWEIGNEVFGNGFYERAPSNTDAGTAAVGYEEDLHVPYDGTPRTSHPALSGSTYGSGVQAYAAAMKAVDSSIKVGAVLNTPPNDDSWGPTWNADVLAQAGPIIDFAIVHLYTSRNAAGLLRAPAQRLSAMTSELRGTIGMYAGDNASRIELVMTELGPNFTVPTAQAQAEGLFAADTYVSLFEQGFVNVDWLELHNGTFLTEQSEIAGPAFSGITMAHLLGGPGDTLLAATSDQTAIVVHAAARADGTLGLMLINDQPAASTDVTVSINGATLASSATRFDYAPTPPTANGAVAGPTSVDGMGNTFTITVPAYTAIDLTLSPAGN
jgi:hypothetical protein